MRLGQGLVSQNPWRSPPPPLFFCLCLVLNQRYQTSRRPPILSHPSASTDLFVLPASPPRVAHHPSRGSFSQKLVRSDVARPAADYMPFRNPMLRESRVSDRFPVFSAIQNLRNFLTDTLPMVSLIQRILRCLRIFKRLLRLIFEASNVRYRVNGWQIDDTNGPYIVYDKMTNGAYRLEANQVDLPWQVFQSDLNFLSFRASCRRSLSTSRYIKCNRLCVLPFNPMLRVATLCFMLFPSR